MYSIFSLFIVFLGVATCERVSYPCENVQDCIQKLKLSGHTTLNTTCNDGICVCMPGEQFERCDLALTQPLPVLIGETCNNVSVKACVATNAYCDVEKSVCVCSDGHVPTPNKKKCMPVVKQLSGECLISDQCAAGIPHSRCDETHRCVCAVAYHNVGNECWDNVPLGGKCGVHSNCSTVNAQCINGKCTCAPNHKQYEALCVHVRDDDSVICTRDTDCAARHGLHVHCHNETCSCNDKYHMKDLACIQSKGLRETCVEHYECVQPGAEEKRLECIEGECRCFQPYIEDNGLCINSAVYAAPALLLLLCTVFISTIMF